MVINVKATIDGIDYRECKSIKLDINSSENNSSSQFNIELDSPYGRYANTFTIGEEIKIYADKDAEPTTLFFTGIIEEIIFDGEGNYQSLTLKGRDYSARLQDVTIQPIVYSKSEVSTIVKNIIDLNCQDVTYTNVDTTSVIIEQISFNHQNVFEAISSLAEMSGYVFWIDKNKDVNFKLRAETDSGLVFNNSNILNCSFDTTREGMANKVWVYGDRVITGTNDFFIANGTGSSFTTTSKPHDVKLFVNDILLSPGGVGGIDDLQTVSVKYLVYYNDRKVVLTSGTVAGNNIPGNGAYVSIDYGRKVPIVKYGEDTTSIAIYGPKTKVISDKSIQSNTTAQQLLNKTLLESNPWKNVDLNLTGWYALTLNNTVTVVMDNFSLNDNFEVIGIFYDFTKQTNLNENVITLKVNRKTLDITDKIKELDERITSLESPDETQILTRYYQTSDNFQVVGSKWNIYSRTFTSGQAFLVGNPPYAVIGQSRLGVIGALPTYQLIVSGGYQY